ncbi:MAG: ATP-binding cassette domain-containing protein [Pseudomonadota bacterium]
MLRADALCVRRDAHQTLSDISFSVEPGQTLAVVGESGAGKSTLLAAVLGLVEPASGAVRWNGAPVSACRPSLVMQEPRAAFNPALPLRRSVFEPVVARGAAPDASQLDRLCGRLELPVALLDRRPHEVSIGQAQRVGILRALIAAPPLVLFDEPLSALDAVTQKHTARLISELQQEYNFTALVVTHDLGYAAAHSDNIAVLRNGHMEEVTGSVDFIAEPQSAYGRRLLDAAVALGAVERAA